MAAINLELLAFLGFSRLTVVAWRRFGAPYGLFATLSLALPLSVAERPLAAAVSLPRFGLVVFPFFLALAVSGAAAGAHRDRRDQRAAARGRRVQWALWQWVA